MFSHPAFTESLSAAFSSRRHRVRHTVLGGKGHVVAKGGNCLWAECYEGRFSQKLMKGGFRGHEVLQSAGDPQ